LARGDWINLYKVYEVVRDDVGGKHVLVRNGWATADDIRRFTETAQSPQLLGDAARHAGRKRPPPPDPMTLDGAKALIGAMVRSWVSTKISAATAQPQHSTVRKSSKPVHSACRLGSETGSDW
jgi:hypothetical protein